MVTVTLKHYNSKYFPVLASWKIGKSDTVQHTSVYETKEQAINYLSGRFGKIKVIDKL